MKWTYALLFGLSAGMLLSAFYNPILHISTKFYDRNFDNNKLTMPKSDVFQNLPPILEQTILSSTTTANPTTTIIRSQKNISSTIEVKSSQQFINAMESLQAERRMTIKRACQKIHRWSDDCNRSEATYAQQNNSNGFYSKTYKYTICSIQKCGYSTWINAMLVHDGFFTLEDLLKHKISGSQKIDLAMNHRDLSSIPNESQRIKIIKESLKIIQVRNPFERIVSAYNDKMVPSSGGFSSHYGPLSMKINKLFKPRRRLIEDRNKNDTTASFEDFVNFLLSTSDKNKDAHWERYEKWCKLCIADYDYIIKFETIIEDLEYLKIKLNMTNEDHKHAFIERGRKTRDDKTKLFFNQISKPLALKLYEHYKNDFLLFGYEKSSWLC